MKVGVVIALIAGIATAVLAGSSGPQQKPAQPTQKAQKAQKAQKGAQPGQLARATFAGGCFWCMEPPYDELEGVVSTTSGYIGGRRNNPTYEEVSSGGTGHTEAVQIVYDPAKVSYQKLLDVFWRNIDPLVTNRQFCDIGEQYRSAVFFHGEEQKRLAEASKKIVQQRFQEPVRTEIAAAAKFWPAEEYHQDYYRKNPIRYKFYRNGCGRDRRLEQLWGAEAGH